MTQVHATLVGGVIVPDSPLSLPDGTRLLVTAAQAEPLRMMTEEEQGDDPASIARWLAAADAIPVVASSPFDDSEVIAWREAMRKHNLEAVREQMEAPE